MRSDETKGLLKNINSTLPEQEIDAALSQYNKNRGKNANDKIIDYNFSDVGALCKILSQKADKMNYITKAYQDECTPIRIDDRFGITFDELYKWLEKLAKDDKYYINREACRKLLNGSHYKGLKIRDDFYLPQIRECGQLILREMKQ